MFLVFKDQYLELEKVVISNTHMKISNNDSISVIFCVLLSWFCATETDTPKKAVVNKPETKEAPAPKRDRIIGGIGGGGFMGGKEKGEVCFFE